MNPFRTHLRRAAAAASTLAILATGAAGLDRAEAAALVVLPAEVAVTTPAQAPAIAIDQVVNFRDALATAGDAAVTTMAGAGLKDGVLWRSGKLAKASAADRAALAALLAGGTVIDLRTTRVATASPDPELAGVSRVAIPMSGTGSYRRFVISSSRRKGIAAAIRTVAAAPGPVLIHCTYGRDRTGWTVAMIYFALGLPEDVVRAEYLKSSGATNAKLDSGLRQARRQYGSVQRYLTKGLGLSPEIVAALKAKLVG